LSAFDSKIAGVLVVRQDIFRFSCGCFCGWGVYHFDNEALDREVRAVESGGRMTLRNVDGRYPWADAGRDVEGDSKGQQGRQHTREIARETAGPSYLFWSDSAV